MLLFFLFILVPLLEIYLFIKIGGFIGTGPTVLAVVLTAVIGVGMLRAQGLDTLTRFRNAATRGESPALELLGGILLLLGGALLLTPGFFTDAVGLLCLLRTSRMWIVRHLVRYMIFTSTGSSWEGCRSPRSRHRPDRRSDTLEGRFRGHDLDD